MSDVLDMTQVSVAAIAAGASVVNTWLIVRTRREVRTGNDAAEVARNGNDNGES